MLDRIILVGVLAGLEVGGTSAVIAGMIYQGGDVNLIAASVNVRGKVPG